MSKFVHSVFDIQKGVKVESDTYFDSVDPYLVAAENDYLKPYLGEDLLEVLAAEDLQSERIEPIADMIKIAVSCFAFYHLVNEGSLKINEHGAIQSTGDHHTTPSKWRDDNQKAELIRRGDKALDDLLDYLVENIDQYQEWKSSKFYFIRTGLIIGKASTFDDYVPISASTRVFLRMLPDLKKADALLRSYICNDLYDRVKAHLKESEAESEAMTALIPYLQEVAAYETITRVIPRFNFFITPEGIMIHSINEGTISKQIAGHPEKKEMKARYTESLEESRASLISFLKENSEDYPEYANSPCFGKKITAKPYYAFENITINKFFAP